MPSKPEKTYLQPCIHCAGSGQTFHPDSSDGRCRSCGGSGMMVSNLKPPHLIQSDSD